ncbi:hypothetical protein AMTRI_Chr02g218630 [Amborella trichopoda]
MNVFEVTLISAMELQPQRSTKRKIDAVLWIAPQEKQQQIKQKSKVVNAGGRVDAVWKKFIFYVDDNFLFKQTSQDDENAFSVIVKIYEKRGFLLSDKPLIR